MGSETFDNCGYILDQITWVFENHGYLSIRTAPRTHGYWFPFLIAAQQWAVTHNLTKRQTITSILQCGDKLPYRFHQLSPEWS
jgi:hypothetical protein